MTTSRPELRVGGDGGWTHGRPTIRCRPQAEVVGRRLTPGDPTGAFVGENAGVSNPYAPPEDRPRQPDGEQRTRPCRTQRQQP